MGFDSKPQSTEEALLVALETLACAPADLVASDPEKLRFLNANAEFTCRIAVEFAEQRRATGDAEMAFALARATVKVMDHVERIFILAEKLEEDGR